MCDWPPKLKEKCKSDGPFPPSDLETLFPPYHSVVCSEPYMVKEKRRKKEEEEREVARLERWVPSPTLQQSLKDFLQPPPRKG